MYVAEGFLVCSRFYIPKIEIPRLHAKIVYSRRSVKTHTLGATRGILFWYLLLILCKITHYVSVSQYLSYFKSLLLYYGVYMFHYHIYFIISKCAFKRLEYESKRIRNTSVFGKLIKECESHE